MEFLLPIVIIGVLIGLNGLFVAAEFAIAAAPHTRVAQLAAQGSPSAHRVLSVLRNPVLLDRYISTAQVGITIASLGLGMYGEHTLAGWLEVYLAPWGILGEAAAHTVAGIVAVVCLTYLHVVLGEMVPKSLALQSAAPTAIHLSATMAVADRIFLPLTSLLNRVGNIILQRLGMPSSNVSTRLISSDELAYIVEESSEGGLLDPTEQLYLENILDFGERTIGQVMTPRTRMDALPVDADEETTLARVCDSRHSRYPVYEGDRDNIIGILHLKDMARVSAAATSEFDLRSLVRPAVVVPESLSLQDMLILFRDEHFQIAVVLDEYGGTAGLITLEDLAEELIGEIQDEFDQEIPPIREMEPGWLRVRGDLLLDELTQHYGLNFDEKEGDTDTVGGLIMARLGHVATPGEEIQAAGAGFVVESVDGLAVRTVLVTLPPEHTDTLATPVDWGP